MMKKNTVLIVDDEKSTREGMKRALEPDYHIQLAKTASEALTILTHQSVDLVVTDLRMPGMDGLQFIQTLNTKDHPPITIMLTAYGSIEAAVEVLKAGAEDFLTKPINLDTLKITINRALEKKKLKEENKFLRQELASKYAFSNMIGKSESMQMVFDTLKQAAPARTTVLLSGESGTGKELAARALHQLSNRANKPFITVHCAALSSTLLESELFGHEKGAFTGAFERRIGRFEAANGGSIFLDEISAINPSIQITLLRVLETRSFERVGGNANVNVDVRLIAASNRNLKTLVDEGQFREDLYYRLDVLRIHLPPLRNHRDDIPLLLRHYLDVFTAENKKTINGFTAKAIKMLAAYHWPGNIRELRNCVERMVVLSHDKQSINEKSISTAITAATSTQKYLSSGATLNIRDNERQLIIHALETCSGNQTTAAERLGISRRTLHRKVKLYDI